MCFFSAGSFFIIIIYFFAIFGKVYKENSNGITIATEKKPVLLYEDKNTNQVIIEWIFEIG